MNSTRWENEGEADFINQAKESSKRKIVATPFSQVVSRQVNYLWDPYIAKRKLTVFAGYAGKGKSQMLVWIAGNISNGTRDFPKGRVAMLSAEDAADDTIRPRLMAVGANLDNVVMLEASQSVDSSGKRVSGMVRLDEDVSMLADMLSMDSNYSLIIIDPISAYLGHINEKL